VVKDAVAIAIAIASNNFFISTLVKI